MFRVPVLFAALFAAAVVLADRGKMILAAAIILIAVIFIAGLIYFDRSPGDYTGFFQKELSRSGIERGGQPAEGFSAPIYLDVFPGFVKEDFNGVQSFEGIYNFNGTELIYTRTGDNPVTSAEDVISDEGYKTLLSNASKRLGVEVKSDADIATLLEILSKAGLDTDTEITDDDTDNGSTGIFPFDSGAMGRVLIGPTCPVVRDPPDPNCADKGYMTSVKVIEKNTTKSSLFASVETDKDGNYKVILPPGTYRLQADGGDPFPYCDWKEITIAPDTMIEIDLLCDTGIR